MWQRNKQEQEEHLASSCGMTSTFMVRSPRLAEEEPLPRPRPRFPRPPTWVIMWTRISPNMAVSPHTNTAREEVDCAMAVEVAA
ncbi:hypothetical protein E2C01_021899 [Portunus trituberculatus]|uniref:Uncharacterized protein n=1 Tax=Portunus trituberculatus TaxID=210409 RepID=A0A5B7E5K6_PORTR|nr:hypothetical protein [Portunus trituberculatus]